MRNFFLKPESLHVSLLNTQSVKPVYKILSLQHFLLTNPKNSITALTETWLSPKIPNNLICPFPDFDIIREDRPTGRGGGVAIILRSSLVYSVVPCTQTPKCNILCIDIFTANVTYRVIVCYRPPQTSFEHTQKLLSSLFELCTTDGRQLFLLGDFNFSSFNWQNLSPNTNSELSFHAFLLQCKLTQIVHQPTRKDRILDLVCTNSPSLIQHHSVIPPFCPSDHNQVVFSVPFYCPTTQTQPNVLKPNFNKINFHSLNTFFANFNWNSLFLQHTGISNQYQAFVTLVQEQISQHSSITSPKSARPSLPSHINKMLHHRDHMFRRKNINTTLIKLLTNRISKSILKFHQHRESKITKPIHVFRHLNSSLKPQRTIPHLYSNGTLVTTDQDKANAFATYFTSVHKPPKYHFHSLPHSDISTPNISRVEPYEVFHLLSKLPNKFNNSPDGIPFALLKKCSASLSYPVAHFLNFSFMSGDVPELWKTSFVVPIHKKGPPSSVNNYRPISLTSSISKIAEKIVKKQLLAFFSDHKLIPSCQHGFQQRKSTLSQLLDVTDCLTRAKEMKHSVDVIYFDFKKAFDLVDLTLLTKKLADFGVSGSTFHWIRNFLVNRTFQTLTNGKLSSPRLVLSGVPQGSVLGPLLFIVFISDLTDYCKTEGVVPFLFADDLKIVCNSFPNSTYQPGQVFINKLTHWAKSNRLELSLEKCSLVHFFPKTNCKAVYSINSHFLPPSTTIRDLGVYFDQNLSFSTHIEHIIRSSKSRLFCVLKAFRSNKLKPLLLCYTSYVRPIIEYCSPVFNPHLSKHIKAIEAVQKLATRIICHRVFKKYFPYSDRLKLLRLQTLHERRSLCDSSTFNSIVSGSLLCSIRPTFSRSKTRTKYIHESCKSVVRYNYFLNRVIRQL